MIKPPLSARELQIASLYAQGRTSREIATGLHILPTTVRNHVATIYRKLQASNDVLQLSHSQLGIVYACIDEGFRSKRFAQALKPGSAGWPYSTV